MRLLSLGLGLMTALPLCD